MTALQPTDADRAIYIDFEGLGTVNAKPALHGVLCTDGRHDCFCQYVLDDRLARAIAARPSSCTPMSLDDAVRNIVDRAERENRPIVSWSTHELTAIARWCRPDLVERFGAVYRNALDTARPWKRALYSSFEFKTDRLGGKHPLKQYFTMIGYDLPPRLLPASPAKWLGHVVEQMEKHGGRYRSTTSQTKRDWHKLLEYNEHDCRGMRQVCLQAAKEFALWDAYRKARFVVLDGSREISIYPESRSPKVDALLARMGVERWALLTAYNPESRVLSREENERRSQELSNRLTASGYSMFQQRDATQTVSGQPNRVCWFSEWVRKKPVPWAANSGSLPSSWATAVLLPIWSHRDSRPIATAKD